MSQIRIGFGRVPAGSAARQAEQETLLSGAPRPMRIQAGSAARAAEDARRTGQEGRSGGASFSLRAQGGRVERRETEAAAAVTASEAVIASTPVVQRRADDSSASPQATDVHAARVRPVEVASGGNVLRAAPPAPSAGRLTSFLRGLFLPEESS